MISRRILFNKIAIIHGKVGLSKIKGTTYNVFSELASTHNVLPRPADFNKLSVVKLNWNRKHWAYDYFELVQPSVIYQTLDKLRLHKKVYQDISVSKGLSSNEMEPFGEENIETVLEKIIQNEQPLTLIEHIFNMHRPNSN